MSFETFIIGDTHFFHKNIIKYCNRPFESVEEMNEILIQNWNNEVREQDKIIVNGDFALGGKEQIIEVGKRLKGRKTLILGNHDGASLKTYYEAGFEMVIDCPIMVDEFFMVSHMPQYVQSHGVYANIFAHVHDNPMYASVSPRSFCTSVERIGYTPINIEDVKRFIKICEQEANSNG